jgi:xylulokinase
MAERSLRLGIDLGTSAVKAVFLDPAGGVAAAGEASFPTLAETQGQAEQATEDWLAATAEAVAEAGRALGADWPRRVAAIGLAGQLPTLVPLGPQGPVGPAIAWSDSRADASAARRLDAASREHHYRRTGMPIDGRYLAPMFAFHWQSRRASLSRILSAKDYLCFALTGCALTDPSTAAGYGVYALEEGRWDAGLCAVWDLDPALLPEVRPAADAAGPLSAAGGRWLGLPEGLPVSVGAADSVAGALAMGGLEEGTVCLVMGSGTVIIDAVRRPHLDPKRRYLLTPHARPGWFGREMDVLATGSGFRWLAALLGATTTELEAMALRSPPGARGLLFAPYLAGGEQGALWDPSLAGTLHGLGLHQGPADMARAFLEGAAFEIRRCLEVLAEDASPRRVVLAGHLARNPAPLQIFADILRHPVEPFAHVSPAALGAALLAPCGGAPSAIPRTGRALQPGPASAGYAATYRRYLDLFPRIALPSRA